MVNRLQYWLHARTRYNLHSPFLFDLYDRVLVARLDAQQKAALIVTDRREQRYREMVFKLSDYCALQTVASTENTTVLAGTQTVKGAVVMCQPHRTKESERQWQRLCDDTTYNIAIDMFDVGIVLHNPHLLPQRFLLR